MKSIGMLSVFVCSVAFSQPFGSWQPPAEGAGELHYQFDPNRRSEEPAEGAGSQRPVHEFEPVLHQQHRMHDGAAGWQVARPAPEDACRRAATGYLADAAISMFVHPYYLQALCLMGPINSLVSCCLPQVLPRHLD